MTRTILLPALMIALIAGGTTAPSFAQNRFMDEARDAANRRAENKAIREAEHPEETAPAKPATTASTATPAPAETAPASQSAAPAAPAEPAAPPAK